MLEMMQSTTNMRCPSMTSKAVEMVDGIISFRSYAFKAKIVRYTIEIIFVAIDMIQDEYRVYLLTLFPKQQGHKASSFMESS